MLEVTLFIVDCTVCIFCYLKLIHDSHSLKGYKAQRLDGHTGTSNGVMHCWEFLVGNARRALQSVGAVNRATDIRGQWQLVRMWGTTSLLLSMPVWRYFLK
jgi:hypothetical protein